MSVIALRMLECTDFAGANDGHVSSYKWDWLLKHRKKASFPISDKEKQEKVDP